MNKNKTKQKQTKTNTTNTTNTTNKQNKQNKQTKQNKTLEILFSYGKEKLEKKTVYFTKEQTKKQLLQ